MFRGSASPVIRPRPIAPHPSLLPLISIRIETIARGTFIRGTPAPTASSRFDVNQFVSFRFLPLRLDTASVCPRAARRGSVHLEIHSACAAATFTSGLSTSRALPRRSGHASPPASACQTASPVLRAGPNQCWSRAPASSWMGEISAYGRPPAFPPRVRYGARGGGGCGRGGCDIGTIGLRATFST